MHGHPTNRFVVWARQIKHFIDSEVYFLVRPGVCIITVIPPYSPFYPIYIEHIMSA